jgi:hypothetical protein
MGRERICHFRICHEVSHTHSRAAVDGLPPPLALRAALGVFNDKTNSGQLSEMPACSAGALAAATGQFGCGRRAVFLENL